MTTEKLKKLTAILLIAAMFAGAMPQQTTAAEESVTEEPAVKQTEADVFSADMQEFAPETEMVKPEEEKAVPDTKEAVPEAEKAVSDIKEAVPETETAMPDMEEIVPSVGGEENHKEKEFFFAFGEESAKEVYKSAYSDEGYAFYRYENVSESVFQMRISSSDTSVIRIVSPSNVTVDANDYAGSDGIDYEIVGVGVADIIVTVNNITYKKRIYVVPEEVDITAVRQTAYQSVTVTWKKVPGCSGYRVERTVAKEDQDWKPVTTVYGADTVSAEMQAEWEVSYTYRVVGFVTDGVNTYDGDSLYSQKYNFTVKKIGAELTSVKRSGSSLQIKWSAIAGATGYKLYRGTSENGTYKCIYTAKNNITSYKQKVKKGVTYYYKLRTVYPEGESDFSSAVSRLIPKSGKAKMTSCSRLDGAVGFARGQYGGNWTSPDKVYYYQAGGTLHVLSVQSNGDLKIYSMTSAMKIKSARTIHLKYDYWGGFYQGTDGNFYVAVGYNNQAESKKKTVIKVIQYDSKWKKRKTASIKGGASNSFQGIYCPFDAGNCRMDMQGNTLYLITSRTMFKGSDGLRHQSNISFKINTKTMKASEANDSYASHSFNQFVKFKDGSLYVLDHGDAYPRSLRLLMVDNYGTEEQKSTSATLFSFQGETGANFTGHKVCGMEVGEKNVIACGISQPHKYKVKGVSGCDYGMAYNLYITVTSRETGKTKVKWLTAYNPKSTNVTVGEPRMVKLADNRFAIMYTTTQKGKEKLHYVVISDTGKKVYSKTYANIKFSAASQPILNKGYIVWVAAEYVQNGIVFESKAQICRIPARY